MQTSSQRNDRAYDSSDLERLWHDDKATFYVQLTYFIRYLTYKYLGRVVEEDLEDLISVVIIHVTEKLNEIEYDPAKGSFPTFVRALIRNGISKYKYHNYKYANQHVLAGSVADDEPATAPQFSKYEYIQSRFTLNESITVLLDDEQDTEYYTALLFELFDGNEFNRKKFNALPPIDRGVLKSIMWEVFVTKGESFGRVS